MSPRAWPALLPALAAALGCGSGEGPLFCDKEVESGLVPLEQLGFVAHAAGSPGGLRQIEPYTNSLEAFDVSYRNGFRVFEFDMLTLGDGTVVLAHDHYEEVYGFDGLFEEASREEVEGLLWEGKYPILFAEDLIDLMVDHPDIWVIIDSKWDHVAIAERLVELAPSDGVRDRLVPHLASGDHTQALEDIYPFPEKMIAMYRWPATDELLLLRMNAYDIDNVMMWWDRRWSEETQESLEAEGYYSWVHTPAEPEEIDRFRDRGVRVYTDGYISPCD